MIDPVIKSKKKIHDSEVLDLYPAVPGVEPRTAVNVPLIVFEGGQQAA
jgi:hypothetical protein